MRVAEENIAVVYLLTDKEIAALYEYYHHGQFENGHPILCTTSDRDAGKSKDTKFIRYIDVHWPNGGKTHRYYRQDHPTNAEVLRISKPINSNDEPKWLKKFLK